MKLIDLLIRNKDNKKIAIKDNKTQKTYKEIYNTVKYNKTFLKSHIKEGTNVAIILPNSIEFIEWYFTILSLNSTVVPIFFKSSNFEIKNIINSCDIGAVIAPENIITSIHNIGVNNTLCINAYTKQIHNTPKKYILSKIKENKPAIMISTSGSSNNPKRVMLNDDMVLSNATAIIESMEFDSTEKILVILPLCFSSAHTSQMIVSFMLGATLYIFNDLLHPRSVANYIDQENITSLTVVPSIFNQFVESSEFDLKYIKSLSSICFGGGPTNDQVVKKAIKKFKGIKLVNMYGQSEAGPRISHMFLNSETYKQINSVGKPLSNIHVKIVDENNNTLDVGREGEIVVHSNSVMLGYYGQVQKTKKTIRNGWLYTGDVGKLDEHNYLYITGRKSNTIICSGINIYPEEIENVLLKLDEIEDVVVYGLKNDLYGEIVKADIVLKKIINKDIIIKHCLKYLPLHKIPNQIDFVRSIGYTSNGKKRRL